MPARGTEGFVDVGSILAPRSIAVIGASDRPGNLGGATVHRLVRFGFAGPVWPVGRSGAPVAGLPSFPSIEALPGAPELAILAVPAESLLETIRACMAKGTRAGIAYAGGLAEAGAAGAELQRAIVDLCRESGFALCGPNCVGVINAALPATATFATALEEVEVLRAGAISMVSQSGGIGTTAFTLGLQAGFDFRHLISSGNEAVVDFSDWLLALARDEGTRVIAGYLEGIVDGGKLARALEEARRRDKPVVLLKAGTTGSSARAALAHTGALVGEDRVFDAVFRELGVVRVHAMEELIAVAALLSGHSGGLPFGKRIGIVSFGGGNGVLAVDQCAREGLETPPLGAATVERLRPLLPEVATAANPVDLTPTTAFRPEHLARLPAALEVVAEEPGIDVLLVIVGTLASRAREITEALCAFIDRAQKPVCVSWPVPPAGLRAALAEHGIYSFDEPADAARAIRRLAERGVPLPRHTPQLGPAAVDWHAVAPDPSRVIPEHRCHALMRAAGLPVAEGALVRDETDALAAVSRIGFPVALKGVGTSVTHRAAAGLLVLDVRGPEELRAGLARLTARAGELSIELEGVYLQEMRERGFELLVAAFRDPLFGIMVSVGAGGGLTELLDDVVTARAPLGPDAAAAMIERLRLRRHARDAMGPLPVAAAGGFVARFSELAATAPWRRFVLEANPVAWSRDSVVALDGLLVVEER